jgi:hypothetical protein
MFLGIPVFTIILQILQCKIPHLVVYLHDRTNSSTDSDIEQVYKFSIFLRFKPCDLDIFEGQGRRGLES